MVAIAARYIVGALVALLVAKGVIDGAAAESIGGALTALVAAIAEYVNARSR